MLSFITDLIRQNWTVFLSLTLLSFYLIKRFVERNRYKLPPGPTGIPLLGYLPFLPKQYGDKFFEFEKKYGKIFSIHIGSYDVVVVSDFDVLKKMCLQDVFNYRPLMFPPDPELPSFLLFWNGEEWKEQRKFSLRILRHLGVGKQEVEDAILEEIDELIKIFEESNEQPLAVHRLLGSSASNVVTLLLTGKRYDFKDPTRQMLDDAFLPRLQNWMPSLYGYMTFVPILAQIMIRLPFGVVKKNRAKGTRVVRWMKEQAKQIKDNLNQDVDSKCFMEAYFKEMNQNPAGKYYDEFHLLGCAFTLFAAGTNTSADFLTWFMLYMSVFPEVEKKMQKEIDEVIGKKRPSSQYRDLMPYSEAVILEVHRHSCQVPSGIFHMTGDDCQFEDYTLPKGTRIVLPCLLIHMNPDYFPEPEKFKPERFITSDGKYFRDERVLSFGVGKRACLGEHMSNTEIFLYIVSILQRFEIQMPAGRSYTTAGVMEFLNRIPEDMPLEFVLKKRL